MKSIEYIPIGIIHSPFKTLDETPMQPRLAKSAKGLIELRDDYEKALADLDKFSHIILIYHFHLADNFRLTVKPPHSTLYHGVFATRYPDRPNPIGISVVRLVSIMGSTLHVENIDVLDGTPLLDIKPFIPSLARQYGTTLGWLVDEFEDV
ncbi:MAG TPA: tRNA (N6-threonylcarbamoyladenosine(37)-N6)-methyltransferase TrmO [candidate division Zixibacteria bacterium]|nr:tRNA (N6-threonylcarbamoyladenosine(37)-N6)-methyltransferase TrmO [candidate division Zixibacteria bacterium]